LKRLEPDDQHRYTRTGKKSRSGEVGTKWDAFGGRLGMNAAVFQTAKTNARTQGIDISQTGHRIRTDLSATLFLNDPTEYDGGELIIEDTYMWCHFNVAPTQLEPAPAVQPKQ
jgi:hypothetical protein